MKAKAQQRVEEKAEKEREAAEAAAAAAAEAEAGDAGAGGSDRRSGCQKSALLWHKQIDIRGRLCRPLLFEDL